MFGNRCSHRWPNYTGHVSNNIMFLSNSFDPWLAESAEAEPVAQWANCMHV